MKLKRQQHAPAPVQDVSQMVATMNASTLFNGFRCNWAYSCATSVLALASVSACVALSLRLVASSSSSCSPRRRRRVLRRRRRGFPLAVWLVACGGVVVLPPVLFPCPSSYYSAAWPHWSELSVVCCAGHQTKLYRISSPWPTYGMVHNVFH